MADPRTELTDLIIEQLASRDISAVAGTVILEVELRQRLELLGIAPSADLAVSLMALAMLLAERAPEWGGDCRDGLSEIAQIGLSMLMGGMAAS